MVKKLFKNKLFYIVLTLLILLTGVLAVPTHTVNAAGNILTEADMDSNLYYKLKSIAGGTLRDDSIYNGNITELDLSFSALGAVSTAKKISSLAGLELLDLRKVTVLKLNNQNVTEITESTLSGMPNLERLEVNGNMLNKIDISQNAHLKVFLADNNLFSKIDLSVMDPNGWVSENSVISLRHNKLTSLEDITLPTTTTSSKLVVNLDNNNITSVVPENSTYTLNLGLQGLRYYGNNKDNIITTTQEIKFFNFTENNLSAKIFKVENNSETLICTFENSAEAVVTKLLSVGNYKLKFYLNGVEFSDDNKLNYAYYKDMDFVVLPPTPDYHFIIDGQKVERINKLTKKATLVFDSTSDSTVYYQLNGGEWVKGSELNLTSGGSYPVAVKAVIGDYESEIYTININASLNLVLSDGILLLLILGLGCVFVLAFVLIKKYVLK